MWCGLLACTMQTGRVWCLAGQMSNPMCSATSRLQATACASAQRCLLPYRGAHTFFIRQVKVARWGGYTVNLIHYEDAASLSIAVSPLAGDQQLIEGLV